MKRVGAGLHFRDIGGSVSIGIERRSEGNLAHTIKSLPGGCEHIAKETTVFSNSPEVNRCIDERGTRTAVKDIIRTGLNGVPDLEKFTGLKTDFGDLRRSSENRKNGECYRGEDARQNTTGECLDPVNEQMTVPNGGLLRGRFGRSIISF